MEKDLDDVLEEENWEVYICMYCGWKCIVGFAGLDECGCEE